jgi:peptidoglycan/xylan/chitin deacetylase (PgdA/CDA1 family)
VLTYHNVLAEEPDAHDWPSLRLSRSRFEEEMAYLVRHFHPLPLSEVLRQLDEGRPDPLGVAVTFDDGFYGVLAHALPVLSRWGIPATVFVMTCYCGSPTTEVPHFNALEVSFRLTRREEIDLGFWGDPPQSIMDLAARDDLLKKVREKLKLAPEEDRLRWHELVLQALGVSPREIRAYAAAQEKFRLLTWGEIRQLLDAGIEIGSHTRTHRTLSRLPAHEREEEIAGAYAELQFHLGLSQIPLAYPYGGAEHVGTAAPEMARRVGHTCALSTIPGRNTPSTDRFLLRRIELRKLRQGSISEIGP